MVRPYASSRAWRRRSANSLSPSVRSSAVSNLVGSNCSWLIFCSFSAVRITCLPAACWALRACALAAASSAVSSNFLRPRGLPRVVGVVGVVTTSVASVSTGSLSYIVPNSSPVNSLKRLALLGSDSLANSSNAALAFLKAIFSLLFSDKSSARLSALSASLIRLVSLWKVFKSSSAVGSFSVLGVVPSPLGVVTVVPLGPPIPVAIAVAAPGVASSCELGTETPGWPVLVSSWSPRPASTKSCLAWATDSS